MPRPLTNFIPLWRCRPRMPDARTPTCTGPPMQKNTPLLTSSRGALYRVRAMRLERQVAPRSPTFPLVSAASGAALSRLGAHRRSLSGCVDSGESGRGHGSHFASLGCFPGPSSLGLDVGKRIEVQSPRSTLHLHDTILIRCVNWDTLSVLPRFTLSAMLGASYVEDVAEAGPDQHVRPFPNSAYPNRPVHAGTAVS